MLAHEYLRKSKNTDRINWQSPDSWTIVPYGLIGEIGTLCEVLKKFRRDNKNRELLKEQVQEEVGDILWYLFAAARRANISDIEWPKPSPLTEKGTYESIRKVLDGASKIYNDRHSLEDSIARDTELTSAAIQSVLEGLQEIALSVQLSLSEIADHAITKNETYWCAPDKSSPSFDTDPKDGYPKYEQLPRNFTIQFQDIPRDEGEKPELIISMNDVQLGDRLTDNTHHDSGYRYHDVFHMCAATFLGWSPVFRRMLKRKRKSDKATDENEDGARAAIIEEAVVSQVYRYGKKINFQKVDHIDEDLIKLIMEMTTEYECSKLEGRDWKLFAARSIELFGMIKNGFNGKITFNADDRTYSIEDDS